MVDLAALASEAWLVFLLSLVLSALALPFVFVFSFIYEMLQKRFARTPAVVLMAVTTFLAVLTAVILLELYLGYTIGQVAGAFSPS
jgi:predicted PurR-regulated permease PerM